MDGNSFHNLDNLLWTAGLFVLAGELCLKCSGLWSSFAFIPDQSPIPLLISSLCGVAYGLIDLSVFILPDFEINRIQVLFVHQA